MALSYAKHYWNYCCGYCTRLVPGNVLRQGNLDSDFHQTNWTKNHAKNQSLDPFFWRSNSCKSNSGSMFTVLFNFATYVKENAKLRRSNSFDCTELGFALLKIQSFSVVLVRPASFVHIHKWNFIRLPD